MDVQDEDTKTMPHIVKDFESDFKVSNTRTKHGRAARPANPKDAVEDDTIANDFMLNKLAQLLPKDSILPPGLPAQPKFRSLKASMALSTFGIKAGSTHSACEVHKLWAARLTLKGTRVIAMVSSTDLAAYMKGAGIVGVDMKTFFRDLRGDGLSALLANIGSLFHATVGPGDLLVIPAHYIVLEHVMKHDIIGLRMALLAAKDSRGRRIVDGVAAAVATPADDMSKLVMEAIKSID